MKKSELKQLIKETINEMDTNVSRLTREQAAIIGAYTGTLCGPFSDMHEYVEKIMGRPVETFEMGHEQVARQICLAREN